MLHYILVKPKEAKLTMFSPHLQITPDSQPHVREKQLISLRNSLTQIQSEWLKLEKKILKTCVMHKNLYLMWKFYKPNNYRTWVINFN